MGSEQSSQAAKSSANNQDKQVRTRKEENPVNETPLSTSVGT